MKGILLACLTCCALTAGPFELVGNSDRLNNEIATGGGTLRSAPRNDRVAVASYYGKGFHGKLTANGERFDSWGMTCAHRTLPLGSWVSFRNPLNGRIALARVNDRGPYRPGREFDLSEGVYRQLAAGMEEKGLLKVEWRVKDGR